MAREPQQAIIDGERINLDLSMTPLDPSQANGYQDLYALFQQALEKNQRGKWHSRRDEGFAAWDAAVLKLLRRDEKRRFDKPLRPSLAEVRGCRSGDPSSRMFHLTKILWARQGLEKHMTDTGF